MQRGRVGHSHAMADALAIRPSQIDVDDPKMEGAGVTIRKFQMRGRLATEAPHSVPACKAVRRHGCVHSNWPLKVVHKSGTLD